MKRTSLAAILALSLAAAPVMAQQPVKSTGNTEVETRTHDGDFDLGWLGLLGLIGLAGLRGRKHDHRVDTTATTDTTSRL